MPNPDAAWNRPPNPGGRWRRFSASLPMRVALLAVGTVWILGCVWSYQEQSAFAASKGFAFPHLLPLVIDGFAVSMAGVAWAASLDARPAIPARLATLVAVAASSASNGVWAYLRANHDIVTVMLGVTVPVAANLAFEVLLAELRRQVQRRRGLPPPVAVPYPRLIRLVLAPWQTFRAWRALVLEITAVGHAVAGPPGDARDPEPGIPSAATVTATATVTAATHTVPTHTAPTHTAPTHTVPTHTVPTHPVSAEVPSRPTARSLSPAPATIEARSAEPSTVRSRSAASAPARRPSQPTETLAHGTDSPELTPVETTMAFDPARAEPASEAELPGAAANGRVTAGTTSRGSVTSKTPRTSASSAGPADTPSPAQPAATPHAPARLPVESSTPTRATNRSTAASQSTRSGPSRPTTVRAGASTRSRSNNADQSQPMQRRPIDPRVLQLAQHLASTDDPDEVTGEMVGPLLNIDVAPRTGRRLLGQARELVRAQAMAQGAEDPELSVIGGR